jgi:ABC-type multidrug transport system fused ATPase/permease subunit
MAYTVEINEPGTGSRRVQIGAVTHVGREGDGIVVTDKGVSRSHLRLIPSGDSLEVAELGSTNGTLVNGKRVSGVTELSIGDIIRLGETDIVVVDGPSLAPTPAGASRDLIAANGPATLDDPLSASGKGAGPLPTPAIRPVLEELEARETDAAIIRYRPDSAGEKAAPGVVAAVRRARRRLAGLGSEPWGFRPNVCLVDPFPHPHEPETIVSSGAVVDSVTGEVWMAVTPESPPESPERALALLFGAALPAGQELAYLLEGYGLYAAGAPAPDSDLAALTLPPLSVAEGELGTAMSLSFVNYLIDQSGEAEFRRFMASSRPGRINNAAEEVYGASMQLLEQKWRTKLETGAAPIKTSRFLRLAARYLRPHVRREIEMAVYMLFGLVFTVVFPFALRRLIDQAIPSGHFSEVLKLVGFLGVAFLISLLADLRRTYQAAWVSGSVVRQIRTEMFGRLQELDVAWFTRHQQGDVMSRLFSDVSMVEQGLSQTLREGLFQLLTLVVSAGVLLTLNPLLGAIVIAGAPLVGIVYRLMSGGARKRSVAVQERIGSLLSVTIENYLAQPIVKAFGLEAKERARFKRGSDRLFKAEVRLHLFSGLFGLSVNSLVTLLRLVVLAVGGWLILHGRLTVGGLVAFVSLMSQVLSPVTALTGLGQLVQMATGALARINEVLHSVPVVSDSPGATTQTRFQDEIRLDDVHFSYTPEAPALNGISVTIKAGQRVAFVGPTGAGKSSILQLLMRFHDPDQGTVTMDGIDLRAVNVASARAQIGTVFQDTFLFDATLRENIAFGHPGATDADVRAAAQAAELDTFIASLPRGYDTPVGERGACLSGGQRQRVAIARALLRDPRILLLDEATSALDPRTERRIAATLDRVGEGRTTIAVTHRLTSITGYDQIFVVVSGKIAERGTHAELLAAGGVYAGLWAEQTGGIIPSPVGFEVVESLRLVPLFAGLADAELRAVADRMRPVQVATGETLPEGGHLVLVCRGRAAVLVPGLRGKLVPATELTAGDSFGVAALMGDEGGRILQAREPLDLLVLDNDTISGLAALLPPIAAVLDGKRRMLAAPAGGHRLVRMTIGPTPRFSTSIEATSADTGRDRDGYAVAVSG